MREEGKVGRGLKKGGKREGCLRCGRRERDDGGDSLWG